MPKEEVPKGYTYDWEHIQQIPAQDYQCGYCGNQVASEKGWYGKSTYSSIHTAIICLCPMCKKPTFIDHTKKRTPGIIFGHEVKNIPEPSVESLYDEARKAAGEGSYTAAVLCCRKLLMHIAVGKGAAAGGTFISYVEYLSDNHFIPPDAKGWVDHIRTKGNEANHEISIMSQEDGEELISFIEMLLKVIFEFPAAIRKKTPTPTKAP